MSETILSVKNIVKRYGDHLALNDVSIDIEKGSIHGLLGPNGAGKTSLIRIIMQIIVPTSGEVYYENQPINREMISKFSYMPEERGLYKKMKVSDQLMFIAQLKGIDKKSAKKKIIDWLIKFKLEEWVDKKTDTLSKGMQQKIQFIATVINEPKLLILDEPFSGFDPVNAELIKNEILELNSNGTTIILSSHRMESVENLCSHVSLINKSKKVLDGKLSEIKQQFSDQEYRIVLIPKVDNILEMLPPNFNIISPNNHQHLELSYKPINSIYKEIQPLEELGEIVSLNYHLPKIEEIFIRLVS
jgi:ABC-2 type transport system ATP-binding protein